MRKNPVCRIELTSQRVRGLRGTSELPGDRPTIYCVTSLFNFQRQYLQESGTNKTLRHSPFDRKLTDGLGDFGLRCSDGGVPLRDRFVLCWVPGLEVLGHAVRSAPRFPSQQVFAHRTADVFSGDGRRKLVHHLPNPRPFRLLASFRRDNRDRERCAIL